MTILQNFCKVSITLQYPRWVTAPVNNFSCGVLKLLSGAKTCKVLMQPQRCLIIICILMWLSYTFIWVWNRKAGLRALLLGGIGWRRNIQLSDLKWKLEVICMCWGVAVFLMEVRRDSKRELWPNMWWSLFLGICNKFHGYKSGSSRQRFLTWFQPYYLQSLGEYPLFIWDCEHQSTFHTSVGWDLIQVYHLVL